MRRLPLSWCSPGLTQASAGGLSIGWGLRWGMGPDPPSQALETLLRRSKPRRTETELSRTRHFVGASRAALPRIKELCHAKHRIVLAGLSSSLSVPRPVRKTCLRPPSRASRASLASAPRTARRACLPRPHLHGEGSELRADEQEVLARRRQAAADCCRGSSDPDCAEAWSALRTSATPFGAVPPVRLPRWSRGGSLCGVRRGRRPA